MNRLNHLPSLLPYDFADNGNWANRPIALVDERWTLEKLISVISRMESGSLGRRKKRMLHVFLVAFAQQNSAFARHCLRDPTGGVRIAQSHVG